MMGRWLVAWMLVLSGTAMADNGAMRCLKQVNAKAMLRRYDVRYMPGLSFKTSSKDDFLDTTMASTVQNSTRVVDPGITTGEVLSSGEFSSSKGVCKDYFASHQPALRRQHFVAANFDRIKGDIARGRGDFLDSFLFLSACQPAARASLSELLRQNFDRLFLDHDAAEFTLRVDALRRQQPRVKDACADLTA